MTRLYIVCEGLTEVNFVAQLLKPHLETPDPLLLTVGAPNLKGHYTYAQLKKFVTNLMRRQFRESAAWNTNAQRISAIVASSPTFSYTSSKRCSWPI